MLLDNSLFDLPFFPIGPDSEPTPSFRFVTRLFFERAADGSFLLDNFGYFLYLKREF